jgi:hypothetical protein
LIDLEVEIVAEFPTTNGMMLGWVDLAFRTMHEVLGFQPDDDERTYILLRALAALPSETSAKRRLLSFDDEADVVNATIATCWNMKFDPAWKWKARRNK